MSELPTRYGQQMTLQIPDNATWIGIALGADIATPVPAAAAMDKLLGYPLDFLTDYKYPHIFPSTTRYQQYKGVTKPVNWNQFLASADMNPADVLTGKHDDVYINDAKDMVANGRGKDFISLGYEGNGNVFPCSAGLVGDDIYRKLWQHIVPLYRGVSGWNGNFLWNYTVIQAAAGGLNPTTAFPGAEFVDAVSLDNYEKGGYWPWAAPTTDHAKSWASENLAKWQGQWRFGYDRGLRCMGTECGLFIGDHGGGDSRYWLDAVAKELVDGQYAGFAYFNGSGGPTESSRLFAYTNGAYSPVSAGSFGFPNASKVFGGIFSPASVPRTFLPRNASASSLILLQSQLTTALQQLAGAEKASQDAIAAMDEAEGKLADIQTAWSAWPITALLK